MAFGDTAFGGNNRPRINQRGRGGGGGNNRHRNRNTNNRNRNRGGGGGGGSPDPPASAPAANSPFTPGAGDPFDSGSGDLGGAFGGAGSIFDDPDSAGGESWRSNAWGLLNQGGIFQDRAFGSQQADWLEGQMQDWYDQWQGRGAQAGDDAATWLDALYAVPGVAAPTGGVTEGWLQDTWGPAIQQYLTARYQSQTPRQRGTQSSAWTGPRRVIQF